MRNPFFLPLRGNVYDTSADIQPASETVFSDPDMVDSNQYMYVAGNPYATSASDAGVDITTANTWEAIAALDDSYIAGDGVPNFVRGNTFRLGQDAGVYPSQVGREERVIVQTPDQMFEQVFLAPTPNSSDNLSRSRTADGIPSTDYFNYMGNGPVTGSAMDVFQDGNRQVLAATPPGAYGPVVGGDDYSNIVNNATYQQAYGEYSTAASSQAMVGAI